MAVGGRPGGSPPDIQERVPAMIEALKSDAIVDRMGGRFKLCTLIQRRLVQLMDGARPLVDRGGRSDLELVIEEILQGKIGYDFDPTADIDIKAVLPGDVARAERSQGEGGGPGGSGGQPQRG